jgi:hypothetical protein
MRLLLPLVSLLLAVSPAFSQRLAAISLPPSGNNQKASVTQYIGLVKITIDYNSPAVHGPDGKDRRGQIWGKLVPYGMSNLGFGNGKPGPWRAGANENTVFTVSHPVIMDGKPLPAGSYGLHMIPGDQEWTVIFSRDNAAWGSFWYEESHDALRIKATPRKHDYREYLTYEFNNRKGDSATAELQWEDLAVAWNIRVPDINDLYISKLRDEMTNMAGFDNRSYAQAAQFTVQTKTNLDQGLKWAEAAVGMPGIGQPTFNNLQTKAQVLEAMGRAEEAKKTMMTALRDRATTPFEIHQYGRQLLNEKKNAEALEVFKLNQERNGDTWPVHVGLARGYAANGDKAQALEHAKKALVQAPDEINRKSLEDMVKNLSGQ